MTPDTWQWGPGSGEYSFCVLLFAFYVLVFRFWVSLGKQTTHANTHTHTCRIDSLEFCGRDGISENFAGGGHQYRTPLNMEDAEGRVGSCVLVCLFSCFF